MACRKTVPSGKSKVGVSEIVGVEVIVGVSVIVGVNVFVDVLVFVGVNVRVEVNVCVIVLVGVLVEGFIGVEDGRNELHDWRRKETTKTNNNN